MYVASDIESLKTLFINKGEKITQKRLAIC